MFFFSKICFLNFFQQCVRISFLVDIRPLFSVLLLPKVPIVLKNALNKNRIALNFLQKTWAYVFISSRSGARGHQRFVNFEIVHWNGKVCSLYGWMPPKVSIISKNALIKSCPKLCFIQKPHWVHMSIFLSSGVRELQGFAIPIPVHYI